AGLDHDEPTVAIDAAGVPERVDDEAAAHQFQVGFVNFSPQGFQHFYLLGRRPLSGAAPATHLQWRQQWIPASRTRSTVCEKSDTAGRTRPRPPRPARSSGARGTTRPG